MKIKVALKKPVSTNESGYTIVELIVAIMVSIVLIGALHNVQISHTYMSQRSRALVLANSYAENKIEALRSIGFTGLTNGTTNITSELPTALKSPRSATLVISSQNNSVKKALLSLSYSEQGTTRTYSYTTYIGELGVGQY